MLLLKCLTVSDVPFKAKSGLLLEAKVIQQKCIELAGYEYPLPKGLELYYFNLIGQGKIVIEIYKYDETEKD